MASLIKEISDETNMEAVRQMGCIITKNLIGNRSQDARYAELWASLDPDFKSMIREAVLAQLSCPSPDVRKQIANLVATIASIDIPRKQWTDLINILCSNATHVDLDIKQASLQTLGFVCEELQVKDLDAPVQNQIISTLTTAIDNNEGGQFTTTAMAMKALFASIEFAAQNFPIE